MYKNIRITFALVIWSSISLLAIGQKLPPPKNNHVNPWIKPLGELPPIASLTDGEWLKGDLHVHSSHSIDGGNPNPNRQPVKTIISFAKSVGFGYIGITDHDNHVYGDVEHNTWAD